MNASEQLMLKWDLNDFLLLAEDGLHGSLVLGRKVETVLREAGCPLKPKLNALTEKYGQIGIAGV